MSISPRFLDEIRSRLTLSDIIGKRIKIMRAGREYKACCPFHKEKTPSFTINDQKGFYHCFGCGAHGDVVGFVMEHDNLPFPEAVEALAAQAGLEVPKSSPQEIQKAKEQKNIYQLLNDTASWFEAQLYDPANREKLEYLTGRGLLPQTLKEFRLGYAPGENKGQGNTVGAHLKGLGYTDQQMIEAGVVKKSTRGGDPYAFFRDRIMFPVGDKRGRIVAFGGRILPEHLRPPDRGDFKPPKYINSSDNPVFHKGGILYSESLARGHIFDLKGSERQNTYGAAIVTEGYMDVIACAQAGFKGAVAPMGTALTEDQILALWKMIPDEMGEVREPILCFDGDNAGRRAAERAVERVLPLLEPGRTVRLAFLPDGEDPDSLIKSGGAQSFEKILSGAMSLIDFLYSKYASGRDFSTPEARATLKKALMNDVFQIGHQEVQAHYRSLINKRFSEEFFQRPSYGGQKQQNKRSSVALRSPSMNKGALMEKVLLGTVLNHPSLYDSIEEEFGQIECLIQPYEALRQNMIGMLMEEAHEAEAFHATLKENGHAKTIADLLTQHLYAHASFAAQSYDGDDLYQRWMVYYTEYQNLKNQDDIASGWRSLIANEDEDEARMMEVTRAKIKENTE